MIEALKKIGHKIAHVERVTTNIKFTDVKPIYDSILQDRIEKLQRDDPYNPDLKHYRDIQKMDVKRWYNPNEDDPRIPKCGLFLQRLYSRIVLISIVRESEKGYVYIQKNFFFFLENNSKLYIQ